MRKFTRPQLVFGRKNVCSNRSGCQVASGTKVFGQHWYTAEVGQAQEICCATHVLLKFLALSFVSQMLHFKVGMRIFLYP